MRLTVPNQTQNGFVSKRLPFLGDLVKGRGWFSIAAWVHRLSGLFLAGLLGWHILSISIAAPGNFEAFPFKGFYGGWALFLAWWLAVPMIFHASNGGRLMLYESFGYRNDSALIRWVFGSSAWYLFVLGLVMVLGDQTVSPAFIWVVTLSLAGIFVYGVWRRIGRVPHAFCWKLQRISGAFLLAIVPAYFIFIHLRPPGGLDADIRISGIQNGFLKGTLILTFLVACFHGGYGIFSVIRDYTSSKVTIKASAALVAVTGVVLAVLAVVTVCKI